MLATVLGGLSRVRVTVLYAVMLAVVAEVMLHLQPQLQQSVIRHSSTNLHNLGHGHLGTLLGSAFVNDAGGDVAAEGADLVQAEADLGPALPPLAGSLTGLRPPPGGGAVFDGGAYTTSVDVGPVDGDAVAAGVVY